jgi:hypothetical protein
MSEELRNDRQGRETGTEAGIEVIPDKIEIQPTISAF